MIMIVIIIPSQRIVHVSSTRLPPSHSPFTTQRHQFISWIRVFLFKKNKDKMSHNVHVPCNYRTHGKTSRRPNSCIKRKTQKACL